MQSLLNNYQRYSHCYHYALIVVLTVSRVLFSKILACPQHFDCNAYLQMVDSVQYSGNIAGHHAMRILPPMLVQGLTQLGLSKAMAFYVLSGTMYILFGMLVYYFLCAQKTKASIALSITLLCLSAHEAMRIPLQLVYQSCDMMVYPIALLVFMFSLQKKSTHVFLLSLMGILVRQNLFVLGVFSLLFCLKKNNAKYTLMYLVTLIAAYAVLQNYYQANGTFVDLLSPPEGYFTIQHLSWVLLDSKLLELIVPIAPLLLLHFKPLIQWSLKYWHISIYMAITVGQPFLAYHMTGNNFPRLALQGAWLLYLALACVWLKNLQSRWLMNVFFVYALGVYFTWGMEQRLIMMVLLTLCLLLSARASMRSSSLLES